MNLSEILRIWRGIKRWRKFWNTTRQLNVPESAPHVGGQLQLVFVYQFLTSNSNFKTTLNLQNYQEPITTPGDGLLKLPISINFTSPLRKNCLSPNKKHLQNSPKRRYVGWTERFSIAWNVNEVFALTVNLLIWFIL